MSKFAVSKKNVGGLLCLTGGGIYFFFIKVSIDILLTFCYDVVFLYALLLICCLLFVYWLRASKTCSTWCCIYENWNPLSLTFYGIKVKMFWKLDGLKFLKTWARVRMRGGCVCVSGYSMGWFWLRCDGSTDWLNYIERTVHCIYFCKVYLYGL